MYYYIVTETKQLQGITMKFTKIFAGTYKATRFDGIEVTIELMDKDTYGGGEYTWRSTHENDWNGDFTQFAKTKSELVRMA